MVEVFGSSTTPIANKVSLLQMLAFPCGIIRGGLASVGMHDVEIKGEVESMPTCKRAVVIEWLASWN